MHLFKSQKKRHRKVGREIVAGSLLVASISGVAFHEYLVGILRKFCIIHGRARSVECFDCEMVARELLTF